MLLIIDYLIIAIGLYVLVLCFMDKFDGADQCVKRMLTKDNLISLFIPLFIGIPISIFMFNIGVALLLILGYLLGIVFLAWFAYEIIKRGFK